MKKILLLVSILLSLNSYAQTIAAGELHSLAVCSNNIAQSWGANVYGTLGHPITDAVGFRPDQVIGITGITAVAGGKTHSLFIKNDGTVWACGRNFHGSLGDGSGKTQITPVQVSGLSGIIAAAGGGNHSLFVKNDGTAWACGFNS